MTQHTPALLALEDGTTWPGAALGAIGERAGEVIFNTTMTGYQEVLTDPSYYGQIVVMTAPHIGNTGVNLDDEESVRPWLSGFVVRAASPRVSSWRAARRDLLGRPRPGAAGRGGARGALDGRAGPGAVCDV